MAGDVGDGYRGLDDCLSKEVQAELGILAVPLKQCVVDYLGSQRWSVCADHLAGLPCLLEYERSSEESLAANVNPRPRQKCANQSARSRMLARTWRGPCRLERADLVWRKRLMRMPSRALKFSIRSTSRPNSKLWSGGAGKCRQTLSSLLKRGN
jgi:hypothetical protein